jgi:bifunctional oligoribonuclease and PAP phosphatase NrnA
MKEFANHFRSFKRPLITTHVRPDGDALGTAVAMSLALARGGATPKILLLSRLPAKYAFVLHDAKVDYIEWTDAKAVDREEFDGLLVVDTGTWSQLPGLREIFENWDKPRLVLDHHLTQESWATARIVDTTAAAAGEVAEEFLQSQGIAIDPPIAQALYVALVSDTGWFQFANTRPKTLRLAADLMEVGVDTDRLNILLNQSERKERVYLQTRAMQSLRLFAGERLATMTVSREDFAATGAGVPATENLVNVALQIASVEVSMLFVDPPEGGPVRVSLRSKGQIDCAKFAEQFAGGGHARAAGLKITGPLGEVVARVTEAMSRELSSAVA